MSNLVYYLSFLSEEGFLFPEELPENYYAPGLFIIEQNQTHEFGFRYTFDAMDNGTRVSLSMVRANENDRNSTLYVVKTEYYGSFWFNLELINPHIKYKGKKQELLNHNNLGIALTTDSNKLERICHDFNFYFIGNTLRESNL